MLILGAETAISLVDATRISVTQSLSKSVRWRSCRSGLGGKGHADLIEALELNQGTVSTPTRLDRLARVAGAEARFAIRINFEMTRHWQSYKSREQRARQVGRDGL